MNATHAHQARNLFTLGPGALDRGGRGPRDPVAFRRGPVGTAMLRQGADDRPRLRQRPRSIGTNGRDVIIAGGGNDWIRSREGKDFVCAGAGQRQRPWRRGSQLHERRPAATTGSTAGVAGATSRSAAAATTSSRPRAEIEGGRGNDEIQSFGYLDPSQSPFADRTDAGGGRDQVRGGSNNELLKGGPKNDTDSRPAAATTGSRGNGGRRPLDRRAAETTTSTAAPARDVCDQGPGTGTLRRCP